ncbi:MAG: ABC transporter substrate-binding protein [Acidimicrobiales bacterium]
MTRSTFRILSAGLLALTLVATACGSDDDSSGTSGGQTRGPIVIGGFNFPESSILANIYAGALRNDGYTASVRPNLGSREVVAPALEKGDISAYIGYAATDLEFWDNNAGLASADAADEVKKMNTYLQPKGLLALDAGLAVDQNAFGVTPATADKFKLKKVSDLTAVAPQLTLGGPPECPTRPFCQPGLEQTYGAKFKTFKALDAGGPLTKTALRNGDIDVGLLFTSDATGFVILEDDKKLQKADAVVPIVNASKVDDGARSVMNKVSGKLTTQALQEMNDKVNVNKEDPEAVAGAWLTQNGFAKK